MPRNRRAQCLSQARDQLGKVAAFHARRHELYDQAQAQNNIGIALYFEGRYDEAIRAYQKSSAVV